MANFTLMCPKCGHPTISKKAWREGYNTLARKRYCHHCGNFFETVERLKPGQESDLEYLKRIIYEVQRD